MTDINEEYQSIIKKCKFISKPDEWFVEGTEAKCIDRGYDDYTQGDKFNDNWSLFEGITNETYESYTGELPREDGEVCSFDEFLIYDVLGNEISELTLDEYKKLSYDEDIEHLRKNMLNALKIPAKLLGIEENISGKAKGIQN